MIDFADNIRLYFKLAASRIGSQMQYPMSFFTSVIVSFFASFIDVIGLFIIFDRFKMVKGWSVAEICLLYGILHMSFAFIEAFARGFDAFGRLIRSGQFDRILVRPRGVILQVLGQEFKAANLGRFLQGFLPFVYAVITLQIGAPWQWALIALASVNGCIVFFSLLLIQATFAFWANDGIEIFNAFTYGGIQMGQFPLSIYDKWFSHFFTFVVPIALIAYYPTILILNKQSESYYHMAHLVTLLSPLASILFLAIGQISFKLGVRRYTSTG